MAIHPDRISCFTPKLIPRNQIIQKMEALREAMSLLDENSNSFPEGLYIQMCNALRDVHTSHHDICAFYEDHVTKTTHLMVKYQIDAADLRLREEERRQKQREYYHRKKAERRKALESVSLFL